MHGSEGGGTELNRSFLPLSSLPAPLETDVMIARCGAGHGVINSPRLGWNLVGCANSTIGTHGTPRIRPAGAWIKGRGNERGRCWLCGHRNGVDRLRPQPVKCPREPFDPDDK